MLTFGSTQLDLITGYAGQIFTDMTGILVLAIGVPLGFWIVRKTISLVRAR